MSVRVALARVLFGFSLVVTACAGDAEPGVGDDDGLPDAGEDARGPSTTPRDQLLPDADAPDSDAPVPDDAGPDASDAGVDAEAGGPTGPQPAEFGLDARPSNTTCVAPARPPNPANVRLTSVYDEIFSAPAALRVNAPMIMTQRPGDGSRWFLAERSGRIVSFASTGAIDLKQVVSAAQLQTLTGKTVNTEDEGGFHGLVFDPDFAQNGRLYVSFTTTCDGVGNPAACDDPGNYNGDYFKYAQEIGYLTTADGGATFTSYTRLLHLGRWERMHYAGSLVFGKDKNLYISIGDGLDDSAVQFTTNLYGKVLRIDVHGAKAPGKAYGIPPTNPFADGAGGKRPEIFAWGFRNPFRMTVDRLTGELWLGDVGNDNREEVDRVELGGNYGWPCREGKAQGHAWNDAAKCPSKLGFTEPLIDYPHVAGGNSVTGGYVYRGAAIAGFQGTYLYGDFIQKTLSALTLEGGTWTAKLLNGAGPQDGYASFAEDLSGEVYTMALFDRKIHKLVPNGTPQPSTFPEKLTLTGCVDPADPTKPSAGVIPFDVNSPLWSDGAGKERWFAIPDGTKITVDADGDFTFPIGTVLMKTFSLGGRRIETRLYIRHSDGEWAGYSYEWNDAQTDATLLPAGKAKTVGTQTWTYPSRSECGLCHTSQAGRSLGLEIGQLNRSFTYGLRISNQLKTLDHVGYFTAPVGDPAALTAFPVPTEGAPSEAKARSYLHSNCSNCHRGAQGRSTMDLRYAVAFKDTKTCNQTPFVDDLGSNQNRLVKPGASSQSILALRMHATSSKRMPPLGRALEDGQATQLIDAWIDRLAACPP